MIALLLALQAVPPAEALPGPIGRQALPASGCAAYLWTRGPEPQLVAMAVAEPATLKLAMGGAPADHARVAAVGNAGFGLPARSEYRVGGATATLELTLAQRPDLTDGGAVTEGVLSLARADGSVAVLPLGGLVGCRPAGKG